jgi:hypothetical protein
VVYLRPVTECMFDATRRQQLIGSSSWLGSWFGFLKALDDIRIREPRRTVPRDFARFQTDSPLSFSQHSVNNLGSTMPNHSA